MTSKKKVEFIIIGQGLAGSLLGWQLIQHGHSILIVDSCLKQTASRTAAGLINPVTGKRLVKTAGVEQYLPAAKELYEQLADFFGRPFFYEKEQARLFQSEDEIIQWNKRKNQSDYAPFLGAKFSSDDKRYLDNNSLGGFNQKQCGYLNTVALLDNLRDFFRDQDSFINEQVDLDDLKIGSPLIELLGDTAEKIIFCDGHHLRQNPWFSWLPLQPVQGEILTLEIDTPIPNEIVQFGKWLLPLSDDKFKLGASWQWQPLDEKPNEKASSGLLNACHQYFPQLKHARLVEKSIGIRPGTRDKQPFLGCHPDKSQLLVFNGFGSKGSLLIPWHAECFYRYLSNGDPLPKTADISRYIDIYSSRSASV